MSELHHRSSAGRLHNSPYAKESGRVMRILRPRLPGHHSSTVVARKTDCAGRHAAYDLLHVGEAGDGWKSHQSAAGQHRPTCTNPHYSPRVKRGDPRLLMRLGPAEKQDKVRWRRWRRAEAAEVG